MLNPRGLEAFYRVMQTGSVSEAARKLYRTQPQISRLIKALEQELGFSLFVRKQMRLEPTEAAWDLLREAERYMSFVNNINHSIEEIRQKNRSHVHILTTVNIATSLLPPVIIEFSSRNPEATFSVDVLPRMEIIRNISSHYYGICILVPDDGQIIFNNFCQRPALVMFQKGDALGERESISAADLLDRDMIMLKSSSIMRERLMREFHKLSRKPKIRAEVTSSNLLGILVDQGMGVALADWFVARSAAEKMLIDARVFKPELNLDYAYTVPENGPSKIVASFIEVLNEVPKLFGN